MVGVGVFAWHAEWRWPRGIGVGGRLTLTCVWVLRYCWSAYEAFDLDGSLGEVTWKRRSMVGGRAWSGPATATSFLGAGCLRTGLV